MSWWAYYRRVMLTAAHDTWSFAGATKATAIYGVIAFVVGLLIFWLMYGPSELPEQWRAWLAITLCGGIVTWLLAFIFCCVVIAPYQVHQEEAKTHAEAMKESATQFQAKHDEILRRIDAKNAELAAKDSQLGQANQAVTALQTERDEKLATVADVIEFCHQLGVEGTEILSNKRDGRAYIAKVRDFLKIALRPRKYKLFLERVPEVHPEVHPYRNWLSSDGQHLTQNDIAECALAKLQTIATRS